MTNISGDLSYAAAIQFLYSRINYEQTPPASSRKVDLQPMQMLLERLENPHLRIPAIHIAGTKGKGSTAAILSGILSQSGYRTGLYTSPHLSCLEERYVVDGQRCSPAELVELTEAIRPAIADVDRSLGSSAVPRTLTFFEITTAMMWLYFVRRDVEIVVLEVGMGGRLDSTNLCRPLVGVITSISFDHTKQLGSTLSAIAGEKAGIIKPSVPVISGVADPEPAQVIALAAQRNSSPLYRLGIDFHAHRRAPSPKRSHLEMVAASHHPTGHEIFPRESEIPGLTDGNVFDYLEDIGGQRRSLEQVELALPGSHQISNAALALAAVGCLQRQGYSISDPAARQALATVRCRARIEVVRRHPTVILDTAHNVASISALIDTLRDSFQAERRYLIFAASRDKNVTGMLRLLLPRFDGVYLTQFLSNPRAVPPERLARMAAELVPQINSRGPAIVTCDKPVDAWFECRNRLAPADLLCITGSFFLAAELEPIVRPS